MLKVCGYRLTMSLFSHASFPTTSIYLSIPSPRFQLTDSHWLDRNAPEIRIQRSQGKAIDGNDGDDQRSPRSILSDCRPECSLTICGPCLSMASDPASLSRERTSFALRVSGRRTGILHHSTVSCSEFEPSRWTCSSSIGQRRLSLLAERILNLDLAAHRSSKFG